MNNLKGIHPPKTCPCCADAKFECVHIYSERPDGETDFQLNTSYHREIWRCREQGHYLSTHEMNLESLYEADYVDSTYGGLEGIRRTYDRIMSLDPSMSDNVGRVDRVIDFAGNHFERPSKLRVLDVGSGLGVFLGRVGQMTDWICTALEPDPRFAQHAEETLSIEAVSEDYRSLEWERQFEIVTLNKVLEHVIDPVEMLKKCARDLSSDGFIYIELPDGEAAAKDSDGYGREEFFLEHHHVFSKKSMESMIEAAGLEILTIDRLVEPSSKYTLYAFVR